MSLAIGHVSTALPRLDPSLAEVHVSVSVNEVVEGAVLRGRLTGPRCPGTTTIEIAYPLRDAISCGATLSARALVPEPCLWDLVTPFIYEGPVELWHSGHCHDQARVTVALRTLRCGPGGVRLHSKPIRVRGKVLTQPAYHQRNELQRLRDQGMNAILAPAGDGYPDVARACDAVGLLLFVHISQSLAPSLREALCHDFPKLSSALAQPQQHSWIIAPDGSIGTESVENDRSLPSGASFLIKRRTDSEFRFLNSEF